MKMPSHPQTQPVTKSSNPWRGAAQTIVLSLILAGGARQVLAEPRYIPTESMRPTLEVNDRILVEKLSYRWSDPKRGDLIVFNPPAVLGSQVKDAFVKRIIGLPGDRIEIKSGHVYVNQQILSEPYLKEAPQYQMATIVIPPDQYFVLGDNRNNSYDSHFWGTVPRENIIGRAIVRTYPFDRLGTIWD